MVEILLLYSADKSGPAARLSEALAAAGYAVREEELAAFASAEEIIARTDGVAAALLIWSRPLISTALLEGAFGKLRQRSNLVQVSVDGLTPPSSADESHTILLSGWRGQPFHPGWKRIEEELKRLCGATPKAVAPPAPPPPAASGSGQADDRPARRSGRRRLPRLAIPALVLLPAAVIAISWIGWTSEDPRPSPSPQALAQAAGAGSSDAASRPAPADAVAPPAESGAPIASSAVENLDAGEPVRSEDPPTPSPGSRHPAEVEKARPSPVTRAKPEPEARAALNKKAARKPVVPVKRFSARNSEPMRLFCSRSGRGTPQCGEFLRATRKGRT